MKNVLKLCFFSLLVLLTTVSAFAGDPMRVYVGEFNVVGSAGKEEIKPVLQSLLAARLTGDRILSVASAAEAQLLINGTYISIGNQYNLDALVKTAGGKTVTRAVVHGTGGQDALFGAVNSLADRLSADLKKKDQEGSLQLQAVVAVPAVAAVAALPSAGHGTAAARPAAPSGLQVAPKGDIIRNQAVGSVVVRDGEIKRLDGMYNLLTVGAADASGKRLLFMAQNQSVSVLYEGETSPLAVYTLRPGQQIISIDLADADDKAGSELYVTVVAGGEVESLVLQLKGKKLEVVAEKLPYFFRALALAGGATKLYAQEQGQGEQQYYGDVYEVTLKMGKVVKGASLPMPRYGNLYSFNQFRTQQGELLTVVYHDSNYLLVYNKEQKELWRSNDKFGGSELFYQIEDLDRVRTHGDKYRWYFMNQRILVTSKQEVLVGKNDGFMVMGNARMYKKGAVYNLAWNGASLEEVWRTKETQNYMPDFYFDEARNELMLLQLTQRDDIVRRTSGATALQIKKVE